MTGTSVASAEAKEGGVIARKYRLESLLGEGGMGSVWRAFNLQLDVPVAIKLLRTDLDTDDLAERLRVEARAAAKLVHPSIVRVFDIDEAEDGSPFIVMELLQGESLGTLLEAAALVPERAVQLLLPIADALALAHSRGVVHRDLKPDNIFIANEGSFVRPKLLDFGIAKVKSAVVAGAPVLTQSGMLLGSPDYMSPEQARGQADIDERSDVWAFCVVLYEALAGYTPFSDDSTPAILRRVLQTEPLPLFGTDSALEALVMRGLAKDRDARPSSIFQLGCELAAWLYARGVREDATGASLETKWLARGAGLASLGESPGSSSIVNDQATLVSVVNPTRRQENTPSRVHAAPRSRHGLQLAAGLALAVVGGAWAALYQSGHGSTGDVGLPAAATLSEPTPKESSVVDVRALPLEPATTKAMKAPVTQASLAATSSASKPTPPRAQFVRSALSLPQALPPAPEKHADLMNPY